MSTVRISHTTSTSLGEELEQIFRQHHQLIFRTAYRVTGSREDAEDVLQTIFLRLLRREFPPNLTSNPRAYLYRAAVNLSLDAVRARKRLEVAADAERFKDRAQQGDSEREEEIHQRLLEAIAELNPRAAEILILRYVHNYSDSDIAKLLGTTRGTIAVSLFRSRARLKSIIRSSLGEKL